jgi:hypothetical protein
MQPLAQQHRCLEPRSERVVVAEASHESLPDDCSLRTQAAPARELQLFFAWLFVLRIFTQSRKETLSAPLRENPSSPQKPNFIPN